MSCPRVHLLVRLVGGELADAEERGVRQHLAACPDCAATLESLRGTWDDLGAWDVDVSSTDLTDRVLGHAGDQENPVRHPLLTAALEVRRLPVAASIALAAGLGIATAALIPAGQASAGLTVDELVENLGLAELATPSATGLPPEFELDSPTEAEVEP